MGSCSALARSASVIRPGGSESKAAMRASMVPYSCSSLIAVFSPTPGTPGMLSVASPLSALRSGICSGSSP